MLEHVPAWLGSLLKRVRAGHDRLVIADPDFAIGGAPSIELTSPAFATGARLPERFTADGEGVSPPLTWSGVPAGTRSLVLIVEDPDAPAPAPFVHAIVWGLPPHETRLAEGAIVRDGDGGPDGRDVGWNSYLREGWLPPDPPTGHGNHDYVFQLFALDTVGDPGRNPGRGDVLDCMRGHVLASGVLIASYSRGEAEPAAPEGAPAVA